MKESAIVIKIANKLRYYKIMIDYIMKTLYIMQAQ